jgi:phosphatidylethanolamine/phosphatidyl-N-methylethanolamine N-methyltransferase
MKDRRTLSVFLSECRKNFAQTGALAPSSRALAQAMTVFVSPGDAPRRILEVGPGTGVFTEDIARRMGPFDHLDVYEINPIFADHVEDRFAHDPCFEAAKGRLSLYRRDVLDLPRDATYDLILSSLPLNNFEPAKVRASFETFMAHLVPGGVLSYFEYVLVRAVRRYLSSAPERERLRQVAEISEEFIASYQVRREAVFLNIPPAVARHLVKPLLHTLPAQRASRALRPAAAVQ